MSLVKPGFFLNVLWLLNAPLSSRFTCYPPPPPHSSSSPVGGDPEWRRKPPGASRLRNDTNSSAYQGFFVCFCPLKESHTFRFTIAFHSSLPGLFRAIQLKNSAALAAIIIGCVAASFFLNVPLASQRAFVLSVHCCLSFVIARLVPGNPVVKPFGVAELLILNVLWHLNALLSFQFTVAYHSSLRLPFARIILDTRPSGSLRSRQSIHGAPGDFFANFSKKKSFEKLGYISTFIFSKIPFFEKTSHDIIQKPTIRGVAAIIIGGGAGLHSMRLPFGINFFHQSGGLKQGEDDFLVVDDVVVV